MKKLLLTFLIAFITALGANAKTATLTLDGYSKSGTEISSLSLANGDISLNVTGGNGLKYYTANKKEEAAFRLYANASMKFTCTNSGEKITKIEFTMSTSNGKWQDGSSSTPTGFNTSTNTWESTEGAQTVTITNGGTSQARFTKVVITYGGETVYPTSCEAPTFNFEENAEVTTGDVIKATCKTENSTVYLKVGNADFEQTDSYPITKELATGPLSFEAYATVQGKDGIIKSDHKILNVNVVKKLGDIKYNGKAVPATISLKGGETLTFTSANAVSMTLVVNGDEANKKTTLDTGEISWTVPAATEAADQTYALSITSKLDDAVKTANTTVTVQKKAEVGDGFVLITDANNLSDGMEFYIVNKGSTQSDTFVMGAERYKDEEKTESFNNRDAISGATIQDNILTPADGYSLIKLVDTNSIDKNNEKLWNLSVDEGYLCASSSSSNYLNTTDDPTDANAKATISFDNSGNAKITFSGLYTRNTIRKNSNSPIFSCYSSTTQKAVKIYGRQAAPSVKVPGDVTSEPAAVEGVITINKNEEITFSSKDAAKLQVSTQSEPVVGSSYKYTPTEEGEVTITPIDSEGKVYTEKAATFTIKFFVAPEAPTFTPDGGDVNLFSTVKIACATEGATLTYKIGDGEATAYPADGIKMTKAGVVTITAIATKGRLSTETTKTFTVTDKRREVYVRFDAKEYEFTVGEEFESPVAKACNLENEHFVEIPNFTETINYASDDTSVAEVNATTGALTLKAAGTCKIKASLKSETYKSDPDYYTLTVNKGLVDGLIEYPVSEFVYTIGSEATLPELVKEPADVDVEYSISHKRVENGVAVYNPATIDEQGNITVNTPGIVTVTATVKADRSKTASYVLEIQSLKEAEIAGTGSATPTGNVYTKVVDDKDADLYENGHLYAILSYHDGKVYAMTPEAAGANEGLKAVVIKEDVTGFEEEYTIDNSAVANMLFDFSTLCLTYNDNGTLKYLVSPSVRHMQLTAETPTESHSFAYNSNKEYPYDPVYGKKEASLLIDVIHDLAIFCDPSQLYFNTFDASNSQFGTYLFNCFLYKVGAQITSASTVKAPVVHITGGNVYYSPDGEWYWGTEDERYELSFANETDGAQIYYIKSSATPSSANVRAMANTATGTLYTTPFKKSDLDGMKITFWAEKDGQKSAVETLNFNIKTGIEDIDVENAEAIEEEGDARYFNLQGLEVKNPGEGIYIRVANGKATKILKK